MSYCNELNYGDTHYKYVYLDSDPRLRGKIIDELMYNVADMLHFDEDRREIKEHDFEAKIEQKGMKMIHTFCGLHIHADIEADYGKTSLEILIRDVL